jgi:succinoglycan biosynthesis transport protein ExoP
LALRDYIRILRKGWILLVAFILAGLLAGAISTMASPTIYSSSAKAVVSVATPKGATVAALVQANVVAQQKTIEYVNVATASKILDGVVDRLHLTTSTKALAERIAVSSPVNSDVIVIAATSATAKEAAAIANATMEELNTFIGIAEASQNSKSSPIRLTVAQQAQVPATPISPQTKLNLVLGLLLGIGLGLVAALVRGAIVLREPVLAPQSTRGSYSVD